MERTVLITGCSSGIGRATALAYLEEEWTVYATARNTADIQTLGEKGADINALDVTDPEDVGRVVDRIIEEDGRIDCLVNNAGYGQHGPLEDLPAELLQKQLDVNLIGPHRLVQAVLPHMRAQEDGTIVNVSSVAGRLAAPGMGAYSASKFALEGYSDTLRTEVAGFGVDVSLVEPGPVETSFRERVGDEIDKLDRTEAYDWVYDMQEDGSVVSGDSSPFASTPEEVAAVILEAGVSTNPDPRYVVGGFANFAVKLRLLPDRLRDKVFGLMRKL
ncbi:SDR family oxidoreductase [Halorarius litoreus]|uniref:SDR family oxidoreductase n=1 Tax=Halorarius litoreus TaxID=2962676 RepID=UPI0020CE5243|nr:SDR family oxidoreductase [Halorarius litoreus]